MWTEQLDNRFEGVRFAYSQRIRCVGQEEMEETNTVLSLFQISLAKCLETEPARDRVSAYAIPMN